MTAWTELLERSINAPPGSTTYERMIFGSLDDDTFDALVDVSDAIPVSTAWVYLKNSKVAAPVILSVYAMVDVVNRLFTIDNVQNSFAVRAVKRLFAVGSGHGDSTVKAASRDRVVPPPKRSREEGPDVF